MAVDWSIVELERNISDGGVVTARSDYKTRAERDAG